MAEYTADPGLDVAPIQTPNLLTDASQGMAIKGQMLANTAQQNANNLFASKARANQYLAQSTGPDGKVDMGKYANFLRNDPSAQMAAGQLMQDAQTIDLTALQNTGMSMQQHFTRLSALANAVQAEISASGGKGISKSTIQGVVLDQLNQGNITKEEAADSYTKASDDPLANAQMARDTLAAVTQNLQAITPVVRNLDAGNQFIQQQTNPNAAGFNMTPVTKGLTPEAADQPTSYQNGNNQQVQTTIGGYAATHGGNVNALVSGGAPAGPYTPGYGTAPSSPSAPSTGPIQQTPLPVIGSPSPQPQQGNLLLGGTANRAPGNTLTGNALAPVATSSPVTSAVVPARQPQNNPVHVPQGAQQAPGAPAGAPAGATLGPVPGTAEVQQLNIQDGTQAIHEGTDPTLIAQQSSLEDALSAAKNTSTGPAAQGLATLGALANQFGMKAGNDDATNYAVFNKAISQITTAGLGYGTNTDAKLAAVVGANPNAKMTGDAIQATGALALGQIEYKRNLGTAWQDAITNGTPPTQYHSWLQNYQSTAPTPFVLALPSMPRSSLQGAAAWIKTQPTSFQHQIDSQIGLMNKMQANQQQAQTAQASNDQSQQ